MKKSPTKAFVPIKYIIIMIVFFIVIPITVFCVVYFCFGVNKFTVPVYIFTTGVTCILCPVSFIYNRANASVIIHGSILMNYINDGTKNFGWHEDIKQIKKMEIADKKAVQAVYKDFFGRRALLIDFGEGNVKYINLGVFGKWQVKKLIKTIETIKLNQQDDDCIEDDYCID